MKDLKNLGKVLEKKEQKSVSGGSVKKSITKGVCVTNADCPAGYVCEWQAYIGKVCHIAFNE